MITILLLITFLIGYLGASIQLRANPLPLRQRIFWLLMLLFTLALGAGYLIYLSGRLNVRGLYLLLLSAGDTAGVLLIFERWLRKHWSAVLIGAPLIGLINLYFAQRHFPADCFLAFALGIVTGLGYLVNGFLRKRWITKQ